MAAKGSVASLRKKLMSRLSSGDDRRTSPIKPLTPRTSDAQKSIDTSGHAGGSTITTTTTKKKKDWPLHHQSKNHDRQRSSAGIPQTQSSFTSEPHQNNVDAVDCLDNVQSAAAAGDSRQQTSAPVDLVASCSTRAYNHSTTSESPITRDVITSRQPQQHNHGLCTTTSVPDIYRIFTLTGILFQFYYITSVICDLQCFDTVG